MRYPAGVVLALVLAGCTPSTSGVVPTVHVPAPAPRPGPTSPPQPEPEPVVETTTVPSALAPVLTVSPPGGAYAGPVEVTVACDDPDAEIVVTTDGSPPVAGVSPPYGGPFSLDASATVRVLATNAWGTDSEAPTYLQLGTDVVDFTSNLPLLVLWSWEPAPEVKDEVYTTYTVSVFEPPAGGRTAFPAEATLSERAGLKIRGSSSAGYPKHPYRLEVWDPEDDGSRTVPLLAMPPDDDWILLAPLAFDRAFVRDALAYAVSNSIGRQASRTRFVEAFLAEEGEEVGWDDYVGIYVVEERVEVGPERVAITPLQPADVVEPALSGGYLFKEDRVGPGESGFVAGTADGQLDFQQPFVHVDPGEAVIAPEQAEYLSGWLDELGSALVSPGFADPSTGRHYGELVEIDAWIDHHAVNVWAKNPDAFRLSGYYHKDREGLLVAGPVWDFDRTLGCSSDGRCEDPTWWDASNETTDTTYVFDHGFWRGLFSDPAFRVFYFARLEVLLDAELSTPVVEATIDAMAAELAEAAPRNYATWTSYPPETGSFEGEIDALKAWIRTRHDWMQGCLELPDPMLCTGN